MTICFSCFYFFNTLFGVSAQVRKQYATPKGENAHVCAHENINDPWNVEILFFSLPGCVHIVFSTAILHILLTEHHLHDNIIMESFAFPDFTRYNF